MHYLSDDDNDSIKLMTEIHNNVVFNWPSLSRNDQVKQFVNMETNSMCMNLKTQNPGFRDSYIQAHVLSMLFTMLIIVSVPIKTHTNRIDHLNNAKYVEYMNIQDIELEDE